MEKFYVIYLAINLHCVSNVVTIKDSDNKVVIDDERFYESVIVYFNSYDSQHSNKTIKFTDGIQYSGSDAEWKSLKDTANSRAFISEVLKSGFGGGVKRGEGVGGERRALDCGAGPGRVTLRVLLDHFTKIDLLEQNERLANIAIDLIAENNFPKLGIVYKMAAQYFYPDTYYDLVWIQALLQYLTDEDAINFLWRLSSALKPRGVIVINEFVTNSKHTKIVVGSTNPCFIRTRENLAWVVRNAGLQEVQRNELHITGLEHYPQLLLAVIPFKS